MRIEKLENILNSGSFHSDISPEVSLALEAKLNNSSAATTKENTKNRLMLDFEEINKEAIKLAATEVKYPDNLPKGVIISVRKASSLK